MAVETTESGELAPVRIALEVPGRLMRDYQALVEAGLYLSAEEALRATLVTGWRYDRGTYHSIRVDLGRDGESLPEDEDGDHGDAPEAAEKA